MSVAQQEPTFDKAGIPLTDLLLRTSNEISEMIRFLDKAQSALGSIIDLRKLDSNPALFELQYLDTLQQKLEGIGSMLAHISENNLGDRSLAIDKSSLNTVIELTSLRENLLGIARTTETNEENVTFF